MLQFSVNEIIEGTVMLETIADYFRKTDGHRIAQTLDNLVDIIKHTETMDVN